MIPETRSEMYLASIVGEDVGELPPPQSRIEHYLNAIAQNSIQPSSAGLIDYNPDAAYPDGSIGEAVTEMRSEIGSLDEEFYVRYKSTSTEGLSLDMFDVCPSQYSIYTYDESDTLKHGSLAGTGISTLMGRLKRDITECVFTVCRVIDFAVALNSTGTKGISYSLNGTSNNVNIRYCDSTSQGHLDGIVRNPLCGQIAEGDKVKYVRDGTKVAFYHYENGEWVPTAASEFFDVAQWLETAELSEEDISLGFVTLNSDRNDPLINHFTTFSQSGDHFMSYDECDARLTALENGMAPPNVVDLFLFMGQSNMAGRGDSSHAPDVTAGAGFEFRAISDPTKLYPIEEPFGLDENVQDAIYDYLGGYKAKSGGMVAAFVNAYYANTKHPIVGVSASEGGTRISYWQSGTPRYVDAKNRWDDAVTFLNSNGYTIRHRYVLWCQGESDGDDGMSKADYKTALETLADTWFLNGAEAFFVVKIGNYNGAGATDYSDIMDAQDEVCQSKRNVVMVSTDFAGMKARDLMKDDFHYKQAAYNEVGEYAGVNTAIFVNTGKEPTMYDTQDGTLYFTHKN